METNHVQSTLYFLNRRKVVASELLALVSLLFVSKALAVGPVILFLVLGWAGSLLVLRTTHSVESLQPAMWRLVAARGVGSGVAFFGLLALIEAVATWLTGAPMLSPPSSTPSVVTGSVEALIERLLVVWSLSGVGTLLYGYLMHRIADLLGHHRGAWASNLLLFSTLFALTYPLRPLTGASLLAGLLLGLFWNGVYLWSKRNPWIVFLGFGTATTIMSVLLYLGFS